MYKEKILKEIIFSKPIALDTSQVYFESDEYLVFYKASGLPSAPLKEILKEKLFQDENPSQKENLFQDENLSQKEKLFQDENSSQKENLSQVENSALREVAKNAPEVLDIESRFKQIEGGLVHRIDTATSGLLLFAKTQSAYDYFIAQQNENKFSKSYTAFSNPYFEKTNQKKYNLFLKENAFPFLPEQYQNTNSYPIEIFSAFRNFGPKGASVRPLLPEQAEGKKIYQTRIDKIEDFSIENNIKKIFAKVTNAYRHQVRSHLSWIGFPILGDPRYGLQSDTNKKSGQMFFFASSLSFVEPHTNKKINYALVEENIDSFFKKEWSSATR